MKGPTPRRLQNYVTRCLGLGAYVQSPGDGRVQPQIPASALLWGLLIGQVLRDYAFHAIEALVQYLCRMWDIPEPTATEPGAGVFSDELLENETFRKVEDVELVLRFFAYRQRLLHDRTALNVYLDAFSRQGNAFPCRTSRKIQGVIRTDSQAGVRSEEPGFESLSGGDTEETLQEFLHAGRT